MGRPIVYNWPAASTTTVAALQTLATAGHLALSGGSATGATDSICALQTAAGAGLLVLNGSLAQTSVNSFMWRGLASASSGISIGTQKTVSLTSANDLSARSFTINGALNSLAVSATVTGPNATTVYSSQLFDTIYSVSVNGAAAAVSVGTGPNIIPYTMSTGIARSISLTSTNNLSAVNVTITGTYLGKVVSESRVGPNNNTVLTTQFFDTVTNISVDAAVTALSAGTGTTGRTHWQIFDYNRASNPHLAVQVDVTGTINYSFQATLDDVLGGVSPAQSFYPLTNMPVGGVATSQVGTTGQQVAQAVAADAVYPATPFRFYSVLINSSTTGSLVTTFIQQGIT